MSFLPSRKHTSSAELNWVRANYDDLNHYLFFNCFKSYNKRSAIRRFKIIVENWIDNYQKKSTLFNNYNKWSASKESKIFWKQRSETEMVYSSVSAITSNSTETSLLTVATNLRKEIEAFFSRNIRLPEMHKRYFIEEIDVSTIFNDYQNEAYNLAKRATFSFQSNYHELLCFSSILLLENNTNHDNLSNIFGNHILQKITSHIKEDDLIADSTDFSSEEIIPLLTTVEQVSKKLITREMGCFQLMNIGINLQGTQKTMTKFIRIMLEFFPLNDLGEIIKEDDLKSRYILPILQSLFDDLDDDNMVFFKVTNVNNSECKQNQFDVSRRRPDGQFRKKLDDNNLITIGYMEAKAASECRNYEACKQDLVRLGIFGKNAIDVYQQKNAFLIQAIGPNLTFFLLQRKNVDVYIMIELDKLAFPTNVNEIPTVFDYLNRIARIVDIFKKYAQMSDSDARNGENMRQTLRSPILRSLMTTI